MSETFAVQLTAVFTAILGVGAIVTAVFAVLAFKKQSREVSDQAEMLRVQAEQLAEDRKVNAEQIRVLGLQAEELGRAAADRDREAEERHRAQAAQVYLQREYISPTYDLDPPQLAAYVRNTSQQPVYGLRIRWLLDGKPYEGYYESTATVMPGAEHKVTIDLPRDKAPRDFSVSAIFRDRAGAWWQTWPYGHLEEIPDPSSSSERSSRSEPADETVPDVG